jgi:hypothetical protein
MKGFSVWKFLIIVVVLVMLGSIAVASYCDYGLPRAKITEGILLAKNITTRISSYANTNKRLPDNINSEFFKLPENKRIESLTWYPTQSTLLLALNPELVGEDKYLVFTATGSLDNLQWQCSNQHPLITKPVLDRNLPHNCRKPS